MADEIADLCGRDSGNPVHQRVDFGEAEIQFGGSNVRFGCLDRRLVRGNQRLILLLGLNVVIQLALRDGVNLRERRIALHIDLRQAELGLRLGELTFRLRELSLRLFESGLERSRINLKENVALVYGRAFAVVLPD